LRVCIITGTFPEVSEKFIIDQVAGLIDQGCEVDVVSAHRPRGGKSHPVVEAYRMLERTTQLGIPRGRTLRALRGCLLVARHLPVSGVRALRALSVRRYSTAASLGKLPFFLNALANRHYDVVHGHFGPNGLVAAYLKESGIADSCLTTFHGSDINSYPGRHGRDVYEPVFRASDRIVAGSYFMRDRLLEHGCPAEKIRVVPVGFKVSEFPRFERTPAADGTIVMSTIARLVEKKGHEWALRALARARRDVPRLRYLIGGDGPMAADLRRLVAELGLADIVEFLGLLDAREVLAVYRRSDFFVLPSVTAANGDMEGQGLVLQEAQATGLPVIATLHDGFPEGVADGKTGFLVPERDPEAIAQRIVVLAADAQLRQRMGDAARRFVEKKYELAGICRQLLDTYREAVEVARGARASDGCARRSFTARRGTTAARRARTDHASD
jgi:colanic acid/amylovoran biosynthesis glycosyltransferase